MPKVFRDGKVHVLAAKCKSCIFRSVKDGRIRLEPGRVAGMVQDARADEAGAGNIACHSTLYRRDVKPAICRGFYDLPQRPALLQVAERVGVIVYDPVPTED